MPSKFMKQQTKARSIELTAFFISTFSLSYFFNYVQYSGRIIGFSSYVGFYIGQILLAVIISLVIALIHFFLKKRFFRIFLNSLWITAAITFLILNYVRINM